MKKLQRKRERSAIFALIKKACSRSPLYNFLVSLIWDVLFSLGIKTDLTVHARCSVIANSGINQKDDPRRLHVADSVGIYWIPNLFDARYSIISFGITAATVAPPEKQSEYGREFIDIQ